MWDWDKGEHENCMCDRYTGCAGCKRPAGLNLYRAMGAIRHKDVVFLECCADVKRMTWKMYGMCAGNCSDENRFKRKPDWSVT